MQFGQMTLAARNTFLIDPKGIIRKVYMKVNPNPHSTEVLAALDELGEGRIAVHSSSIAITVQAGAQCDASASTQFEGD